MVNILMLSKWHVHAEDYAKTVNAQPDAKITCVWDGDVERGSKWAESLGVPFEADLDAALARQDVDAVVVDAPTADHCRVMVKAANAGKHIFTEKAMAPTVAECREIAEAVKKNGVKFCISHPSLISPMTQLCKQLVDEGALGSIHYMRMRTAHQGSLAGWLPDYWYNVDDAGGGAMMDLGCHPMYTAAYLLGKPKRITSMFNTNHCPSPAEDNAVSVVEFANKAIAVLETSFTSPYQANCFELLGTEGAVVQVGNDLKVRSNKFDGGWYTPEKLPEALPIAMRMWLNGIEKGEPILFDTDRGIALTELLENAYRSHKEQRTIEID